MIQRLVFSLIVIAFGLPGFAKQANPKNINGWQEKLLELVVKDYNDHRTMADVVQQHGLTETDREYLKQLQPNGKHKLPEMKKVSPTEVDLLDNGKASGRIKVEMTMEKITISLNGYPLDLDERNGAKERLNYIERVLKMKGGKTSFIQWLVPEAEAAISDIDFSVAVDMFVRNTTTSYWNYVGMGDANTGYLVKSLLQLPSDEAGKVFKVNYKCGAGNGESECARHSITYSKVDIFGKVTTETYEVVADGANSQTMCSMGAGKLNASIYKDGKPVRYYGKGLNELLEAKDAGKEISQVQDLPSRIGSALFVCCGYARVANVERRQEALRKNPSCLDAFVKDAKSRSKGRAAEWDSAVENEGNK